jgi:cation-transporting ATPase E
MKDILIIFRRNFVTPLVISVLILSLILLILGQYNDAWFVSCVLILNTFLAIIQEIRARQELKKLEILSAPKARLITKNDEIKEVMFDQLVVGDLIQLQVGDEIPADGEILLSSGLEVDESILTGESASVDKSVGASVYAASVVVAGGAKVKIIAVGVSTKVGVMSATLKRYQPQPTPLQSAIAKVITRLTYGALGLAILIFVVYSLSGKGAVVTFKAITSSAITIIPEGLLLASSLLLAYGSIKLARLKVLPQKLAAIEAMALLNILCVDKTGTLTSDNITFEKIELFDDKNPFPINDLVSILATETGNGNTTSQAIIEGLPKPKPYEILQILAFSSVRKMSGIKVKYGGKIYTVFAGAPELLGLMAPLSSTQEIRVNGLAKEGKRVMLIALFPDTEKSIKDLSKGAGKAIGLVVLSNELRDGVVKTVKYFQDNGVTVKVISGDNPDTVSYVAKQAGINGYHKVITGLKLNQIADKDWDAKVMDTAIFARVLPEQKEKLVETFRRLGNFTGMVGDGVNDALALKKSDLGVAMYSGAIATRRIADIILLNNSFNSLPLGMKLGNRIIQAIELIAVLFFHKIIYVLVLLSFTLIFGVVYPFEPRHITFINMFLVTAPTIMWTLFPPTPMVRLSPKYFWKNTLQAVVPIAILSGLAVTTVFLVLNRLYFENRLGVSTMTVIIATFFGIYLVFLVPKMFNVKNTRKSKIAFLLYPATIILLVLPSFGINFIREFFNFTTPVYQDAWPLIIVIFLVAIIQWIIAGKAGERVKNQR